MEAATKRVERSAEDREVQRLKRRRSTFGLDCAGVVIWGALAIFSIRVVDIRILMLSLLGFGWSVRGVWFIVCEVLDEKIERAIAGVRVAP